MIVPIHDPTDERIAAYRDVRERDLVGREGLFIAEGEVVLRCLIRSERCETLSLLLLERQAERLASMLTDLPPEVPVHVASQAVMDAIVGFPIHRGILALGRRPLDPEPDDLLAVLPARAVVMCLFGIANHDNMGGLLRNAAAFGVDAVLLDSDCCDPLYRKAIRVSVGAALLTPFVRLAPGADVVGLLERGGFQALALSPNGERTLAETRRPERVAVLLGAEGPGLSAKLMAQAQTVRIPMRGGFDSLNVSTTGGIVLHHLTSQ
ncbi:RNA methyltransferase [Caulobacter segnis]|uniref:TrmH family RNA methyltransferase n=1 Tax=Caulobacter segnis TaxID=88688 RepID=UPI00240F0148|nr:RNA methyltransferase [Caulobacter segnis]MDG2522273.1 RNA methyltransferase [Caulobacter segnis]